MVSATAFWTILSSTRRSASARRTAAPALLLRTAAVWQRVGRHLGRPFGGLVYVEAGKTVFEARPVTARQRRRVTCVPGFPA